MRRAILLASAVAVLFSCSPAWAQKKKVAFSDDAIDAAIKKGVDYLASKQKDDGSWGPYGEAANWTYEIGPTALALYAMLESGINAQDARIVKGINWCTAKMQARMNQSMHPPAKPAGTEQYVKTYEAGLLCNVYNAAHKTSPHKYDKELTALAELMWTYDNDGGYAYDVVHPAEEKGKEEQPPSTNPAMVPAKGNKFKRNPDSFDNSNSQYGVLAVWGAALSNIEVPREYWWRAMRHWADNQCADGGWNYQKGQLEARATMTAAGVASMFVCFDALFADVLVSVNSNNEFKPIQKGLDWFDKNFQATIDNPGWAGGYYLYGVERVGLASGMKYFGTADWFKLGAEKTLAAQGPEGNWGEAYNTALCLLFLIRGQHAVLFNKMQYDGDWRNRSRDLAMLTKHMSRNFERTVNWQIINLKVPVSEWHDAPIVYMAGSLEPKFTQEDIDKLKLFVQQGGTLFMVTEGNGAPFTKGVKDLCAKMFPQYPLAEAPKDHELYSAHYPLAAGKPKFNIVSNGVRALVIHTDSDLSRAWQQQNVGTEKYAFDAGANVYMYVTDKGAGLRPRGTSLWPEPTEEAATQTVKVFRLAHGGNSDPEPMAAERLKLLMGNLTKIKLDFQTVTPDKLDLTQGKVAWMTGTDKFALNAAEKKGFKDFADGGGTIVIDSAGGSKAFAASAQELLAELYGMDALRRLAPGAAIYTLPGYKIDKFKYRRRTKGRLGGEPNIRAILDAKERPAILFSTEDLTAGVLGVSCFPIEGYDPGESGGTKPGTAYQIMRNAILSASGIAGAAGGAGGEAATASAPAEAK